MNARHPKGLYVIQVVRLSAVLLVPLVIAAACVSTPDPLPTPSPSAVAVPCLPGIPEARPAAATLSLLAHSVGPLVIFGLDGAALATAHAYPLGASWHWTYVDADGRAGDRFDWRVNSQVLQSADGARVVYIGQTGDPPTSRLFVRDIANGTARPLIAGSRLPYRWPDANHVLLDSVDEHSVFRLIDVRDGSTEVVFDPPAPPTGPPMPDSDFWELSGDLRWAVLSRADPTTPNAPTAERWLYDRTRQVYAGPLGTTDLSFAPIGDLVVWLDGASVRAMHLCDQKAVALGSLPGIHGPTTGAAWSPDGRYVSFSFGATDEDRGPTSLVVVDTAQGRIAQIEQPWGYVQKWSPDGRYVVLARRGYHGPVTKLATLKWSLP